MAGPRANRMRWCAFQMAVASKHITIVIIYEIATMAPMKKIVEVPTKVGAIYTTPLPPQSQI